MIRIVDANVKKIPRNIYRLIRSFIDSSTKTTYIWNIGVRMGSIVRFVKFGKWILVIYITEKGLSAELCGYGIKIVYNPDILLEISDGKEVVFKSETIEEIVKIYFESDGPYMEPIPATYLIEKFDFYINAVSMALAQEQNKDTSIQTNVN